MPRTRRWRLAISRLTSGTFGVALAALVLLTAAPVSAQRVEPTLSIVAPAAPGGGWDQMARTMALVLREEGLVASVQVENIPGAAGTIGLARFVSSRRGDGEALLITGLVMVGGIVANRSVVTLEQATPIARLVGEFEVIVVPSESPYRTLADLLAAMRANPGAISWGGGSAGGTDQMLVDLLAGHEGIDPRRTNYVAFAGGGEAAAAVLGAQVSAGVSGWGEFAAHVLAGRMRALAISSRTRVPGIDVPTLREGGVALDLPNWRGVVAPPGITPARRRELEALMQRMAESPRWQAELARRGWSDLALGGDAFARFLQAESRRVNELAAVRRGTTGLAPTTVALVSRRVPVLVVLGLLLTLGASLWQRRRAPTSEGGSGTVNPEAAGGSRALLLVSAGIALDLLLLDVAGFVPAATLLFMLTARAFGSVRWRRDAAIALIFTAATYAAFRYGLGLALPAGLLFGGVA